MQADEEQSVFVREMETASGCNQMRIMSSQTDGRIRQGFLEVEVLSLTLKSVQATQELEPSRDAREWVWTSV